MILLEPRRAIYKFRRSRLGQSVLLPFGSELKPDRWIFVVGCYNSGTTVLARALAEHPLIGGLPDEGIFFTDSLPYPEQFGWTRMWFRCLDKVALKPGDLGPETITRIKKQWSLWYPENTPNLLEKSAVNAVRMPFLQAHFQPAYFISIVRNGYAVAEGIRRRGRPARWRNPEFSDKYPIELCAEQWKASDEVVSRDRNELEHFKQVYYEELTSDPMKVLDEVTDFLGLHPFDPRILESTWKIQERDEPIQNMNLGSFEGLTEADLDAIERIAGDCLAKHSYQRPQVSHS